MEQLQSLDRLCMGLAMCSRVKPTSICTRAPFGKTSFVSWIGYGDEGYLKLILTVEKMTKAPDISTYKEEDKELRISFMQFCLHIFVVDEG